MTGYLPGTAGRHTSAARRTPSRMGIMTPKSWRTCAASGPEMTATPARARDTLEGRITVSQGMVGRDTTGSVRAEARARSW